MVGWIGGDANMDELLAGLPVVNDRLRELHDELWTSSAADPVTLELCRLRMAQLIGSQADLAVRYAPARAEGLDESRIESLGDWPVSDLFDERDRAALNFAEKYVIDPHSVTDDDCARLSEHFSPEELAALTTGLALFDGLARFRVALGAEPAPGRVVTPSATEPLP